VLDEGTTFVFGSWVCIANGTGSFRRHLVDDMNPEASAASQRSGLDEFIDNLNEMLLPDLARKIEKESVFNVTSTHAAPGLLRSDLIRSENVPDYLSGYATRPLFTRRPCNSRPSPYWRRTWIACSRLKMTAPTTTWKLLARIMLQLLRLHEDAR
jgi:hypothetical protein